MRVRALLAMFVLLLAVDGILYRSGHLGASPADLALIDQPLLEASLLEQVSRIVVREKPQSRVIAANDDGFEMSVIAAPDAPTRETILRRSADGRWRVENYLGLPADPTWLGQTMRDLVQGRLVRRLTTDPRAMEGLKLGGAEVDLQNAQGAPLRRLEFGRRDGERYQMVRVDGGAAFLANHSTELVGDPLAWISGRVLDFSAADVQQLEMPFRDAAEPPMILRRGSKGAPLVLEHGADKDAGLRAEQWLSRMIATSFSFAIAADSTVATDSRADPLAMVKIALFDGRTYRITFCGVHRADALLEGNRPESLVFAFYECSDPASLAAQYGTRAAIAYNRRGTIGTLPATLPKSPPEKPSVMR